MKKLIRFIVRTIPRPILIRFSKIFSFLAKPFYSGNKVECPICESHFGKFMPYGNQGSENRLCPNCLSLERHRLMWLYLKDHSDFFTKDYRVLHFAPEQPFLKRFRKLPLKNYTTADLVSPIAELHIDVTAMPLPDNSYDVLFCNHVLEHVDSDIKAMQEIYRVLAPGGWAIMQVPLNNELAETYEDLTITDPKERERIFGQYDHVRIHGRDYPERLRKVGFKVEEFDANNFLSPELMEKYRLSKGEVLYLARKS